MNTRNLMVLLALLITASLSFAQNKDNELTAKEKKQGWQLLFNGEDLQGWTSVGKSAPPEKGWKVENGALSTDIQAGHGGDIITTEEFDNFELLVDFKLEEGGNSGIKYFFTRYEKGGWLGLEYQILDNEKHPDANMGREGNRHQAALYDMLPLQHPQPNRVGEWNRARIVAKGGKVTHYLNGKKVLSFDRNSEAYKEAWRQSKFKDSNPPFGSVRKGHILLQEHGDAVSFKNIKIRKL